MELISFSIVLEEPPYFGTHDMGSYVHAQSVAENKENIIGMICYEMIGYFSDEKGSQGFPHPALKLLYPSTANFIMTVGVPEYKAFNEMIYKGNEEGVRNWSLFFSFFRKKFMGMSDQRNYWKFEIPAIMINDTSLNETRDYHKMSDDIETLDFDRMSQVIDSMMRCLQELRL